MTYRSYVGQDLAAVSPYPNETWGHAQSLMMYDIAAIQQMYGANFNTNSNNTTYTFSTTTGEMFVNGVGQGTPGGNRIFRTVWDGNGTDTYDFSNYTTNLAINLAPGGWSDLDVGGNFQRARLGSTQYARGHVFNALQYNGDNRSLIENANGGSGNDTIEGNSANNVLRGNDGNDRLLGQGGADTLIGGSGNDSLNSDTLGAVDSIGDRLDGGDGNDTLQGEAGNDTLLGGIGDDQLTGDDSSVNFGNDSLSGGTGNDTIDGGSGNDTIDGGSGLDVMDGGVGIDTLDVTFWNGAYELNMNTGVTNFAGETAVNFENVNTGSGNDNIIGTAGNNVINTGAGNDTLMGGSGSDTLNGTNSTVDGLGEIDIFDPGDFGSSDLMILGTNGSIYYNGSGVDYAVIDNFDRLDLIGETDSDNIQIDGLLSDYTLGLFTGTVAGISITNGTRISIGAEDIAYVDSSGLLTAADFIFV